MAGYFLLKLVNIGQVKPGPIFLWLHVDGSVVNADEITQGMCHSSLMSSAYVMQVMKTQANVAAMRELTNSFEKIKRNQ